MHWTLQVSVALLNILWIAFFLPPEPFLGNSSLAPESETTVRDWDDVGLTSPGGSPEQEPTTPGSPGVTTPGSPGMTTPGSPGVTTPGSPGMTTPGSPGVTTPGSPGMTTPGSPGMTTPGSPGMTTPGSPGVTTPGSLPEQEPTTPGSPGVTTPGSPPELGMKTPGRPSEPELRIPGSGSSGNFPEDCCFAFYPRIVNKQRVYKYYLTDRRCQMSGAILVTKKGRHICVDPSLPWVKSIMKFVDGRSF